MSVAVLKLGGSLLDLPDLAVKVRQVLNHLHGDLPLLICGGGAAADLVRQWHRDFQLDEEQAHWLALEAIRLNQRLLLELLPECELVASRESAAAAWQRERLPLLDLAAFVRDEEFSLAEAERLPHNWNVTSDSLAAWVAIRWPARRLVLLKSAELPTTDSRLSFRAAVDLGFIDAHFPALEPDLPTAWWCSLRRTDAIEFCLFGP